MVNHHSHGQQPHETDALLERAEAGVTRVRYEARSKWSGIRHKVFLRRVPAVSKSLDNCLLQQDDEQKSAISVHEFCNGSSIVD